MKTKEEKESTKSIKKQTKVVKEQTKKELTEEINKQPRVVRKQTKKEKVMDIVSMILIILIIIFIKKFVFTTVMVHGPSMLDTLHDNDVMILDMIGPRLNGYKRFDIVVVNTQDSKIIKRVIGLPGEEVEYKNNQLYINGKKVKDKYGTNETEDFSKVKLGKDEYYVLGDNRMISADSRMIGPIKKNKIQGKATFTLFPFSRIGLKK